MDFKLVDKKNIGAVSLLLFIIILRQSRFFNFLIDTALGRAFLIAFIIFISCLNKIMGVVSVLLIIVLFNNSSIRFLEGFDSGQIKQQIVDACGNNTTPKTPPPQTTAQTTQDPSLNPTPTSSQTSQEKLTELKAKLQDKLTSKATEGFDLIGTEHSIKKGKQSNSISVNHKSRNSENVVPYEENIFVSSNYSQF